MSDFIVQIERGSTRRKIILSALIGRRLPGLIGIPEKDFEVTDNEIEEFVNSGLSQEENGWAKKRECCFGKAPSAQDCNGWSSRNGHS
jgi:hypothetical protein